MKELEHIVGKISGALIETFGQRMYFVLFAFALFSSAGLSQDVLLPEPEGEILFDEEPAPTAEPFTPDPTYAARLSAAERRKAEKETALRALHDAVIVSAERQKEFASEIDALDKDRETLVDQLIVTARSIQNLEDEQTRTERKLFDLNEEEQRIRRSLIERRAILSEVLAALQRLGQYPPPAIFVSATDALESVRSAILLGSVLPELRTEAEALLADLDTLNDIATSTRVQRNQLVKQERELSEEQVRLDLLIKENQKLKANSKEILTVEHQKSEVLSANATNLRELIDEISSEIASVTRESLSARTAAEREAADQIARLRGDREREIAAINDLRPGVLPKNNDAGQIASDTLAYRTNDDAIDETLQEKATIVDYSSLVDNLNARKPRASFAKKLGLLRLPARGVELASYGSPDGLGGVSKGITIQTRAQAPVVAPADGQVVFSGKFSGFDQLLIVNVGDGYHIIMAGMSNINVKVGDNVAVGEPVAVMGGKRLARLAGLSTDLAASLNNDFSGRKTQPLLYVEFRKNGKSINSSPWWARS